MTVEEARAFIEEAEQSGRVDQAKLSEAVIVLQREVRQRDSRSVRQLLSRALALQTFGSGFNPFPKDPGSPGSGSPSDVPVTPDNLADAASRMGRQRLRETTPPDPFIDEIRRVGETTGQDAATIQQQVDAYEAIANESGKATARSLVGQTFQQWQDQALALRGQPIGVPEGFIAQRRDVFSTHPSTDLIDGRAVPQFTLRTEVEPQYFTADVLSPAYLDPTQIARLQAQMVQAGLLKNGDYRPGVWGDVSSPSAQAYRTVLGTANTNGWTAAEALNRLIQSPLPSGGGDPDAVFEAAQFVKPDKAFLAQRVKGIFRSELGRDPTPAEVAEMSSELGAEFRAAHDARVAADRAVFDSRQSATGETIVPPAGQQVDPFARFQESFEARYKPELDRLDALPDVRANTANVFASLRTMNSLVGR